MSISSVFKNFVEPGLERIPVLEVSHVERHQGRGYVISQKIQRNVFTEFDRKLSRHLAATRGAGFPAFTVSVQVNERGSGAPARFLAPAHHVSVPHALKGIADRAFAHCDSKNDKIEVTVHQDDRGSDTTGGGVGVTRMLGADDIDALDSALKICRHLGEAEFLNISGDFDIPLMRFGTNPYLDLTSSISGFDSVGTERTAVSCCSPDLKQCLRKKMI